jgi:hypothetical protein
MNWWRGANTSLLDFASGVTNDMHVVLYEKLCQEPDRVVDSILRQDGSGNIDTRANAWDEGSHIVMGNKDFLVRNRERIRYDDAWYRNDKIGLAYLLNASARRLNHRLYREAI